MDVVPQRGIICPGVVIVGSKKKKKKKSENDMVVAFCELSSRVTHWLGSVDLDSYHDVYPYPVRLSFVVEHVAVLSSQCSWQST